MRRLSLSLILLSIGAASPAVAETVDWVRVGTAPPQTTKDIAVCGQRLYLLTTNGYVYSNDFDGADGRWVLESARYAPAAKELTCAGGTLFAINEDYDHVNRNDIYVFDRYYWRHSGSAGNSYLFSSYWDAALSKPTPVAVTPMAWSPTLAFIDYAYVWTNSDLGNPWSWQRRGQLSNSTSFFRARDYRQLAMTRANAGFVVMPADDLSVLCGYSRSWLHALSTEGSTYYPRPLAERGDIPPGITKIEARDVSTVFAYVEGRGIYRGSVSKESGTCQPPK